jgi:hypothetical protein
MIFRMMLMYPKAKKSPKVVVQLNYIPAWRAGAIYVTNPMENRRQISYTG